MEVAYLMYTIDVMRINSEVMENPHPNPLPEGEGKKLNPN